MTASRSLSLLAAVALTLSCAAPKPRNTMCREPENATASREVVVVEVEQGDVTFSPPCPRHGQSFIDSPVSLRATAEGLRVRFSVRDESFVPGALRDPRCERYEQREHPERCQRDAVVLYPFSTLPGASNVELETIPRPEGYRVDQVFPWATWGIERGLGRFRLAMVVYERGPGGEENELRLVTILQVTDRRSRMRDAGVDDGGAP